jgi:serine protease Do
MRPLALALLLLAVAPPAMAQSPASSWRLVNRTGQDAVSLISNESGAEHPRGRNRLRQPVAPGAEKAFRRKAGSPCRLDLRLRLADGKEAVATGHDVCATPMVVVEPAAVQPAAPAPAGRHRRA